jgi:hypothetical protein
MLPRGKGKITMMMLFDATVAAAMVAVAYAIMLNSVQWALMVIFLTMMVFRLGMLLRYGVVRHG